MTPRRWIRFCNPDLSKIITKWTGTDDWVVNTEKLAELRKVSCHMFHKLVRLNYYSAFCKTSLNCSQFAGNEDLQSEWREAKRRNKTKIVSFLKEKTGYIVSPDAMFDVQVIPYQKNLFF